MKLMIRQSTPEYPPCSAAGAIEPVIRPVHSIDLHHGPQTAFIERRIVRNQRKSFDFGCDALPNLGEHIRIVCVLVT